MRRAQSDIIGLLLVVVALVIVAVVAATLSLRQDSRSMPYTEISHSFLTSVMDSQTTRGTRMTNILSNCLDSQKRSICAPEAADCCDYFRRTMQLSMEATFAESRMGYSLSVRKNDADVIAPITSGCGILSERGQPGMYVQPGIPDNTVLVLQLCP